MSNFDQPLDGVKYRIRNVDYGTFLERRATDDGVVVRPEKDTPLQHWVFVPGGGKHTYNIHDPDPDETTTLFGQISPMKTLKAGDPSSTNEKDWTLVTDHLEDDRTYLVSQRPGQKAAMIFMEDSNTLDIEQVKNVSVLKSTIKEANYQWEIIQVTPAKLPEGKDQHFRIRTLVGQALQLDSSNRLTLDKEDRRGSHRCWMIDDRGNGICTIFNVDSKKYLVTHDKGSYEWEPTISDSAEEWTIAPTSDFTYAIFVERPVIFQSRTRQQKLSLALDRGAAILKAKKPAHNQIWLIEPEDAALDGDKKNKPDGEGEVAQGLPTGEYKLKNTDTRKFYVGVTRNPANNTFDISSNEEQRANKFKVESKADGAVLYCILNRLKIYLASDNGKVVGQVNNEYVWKVVPGRQPKQFFIVNNNSQALTSPSAPNSAFTLESQAEEARKLWEFIL